MQEDWADKTESATPHKRGEARREGNIPRSDDLTAAAGCIALMLLLRQTGSGAIAAMKMLMTESFGGAALSVGRIGYLIGAAFLPLLIGLVLVGIVIGMAQTGFFFGWRKESGALNPAKGFSHIFSGRSAAQIGLNLLKLGIVSVVVFATARGQVEQLLALITSPSTDLLAAAGSLAFAVGIRVALVLLVLGIVDYGYQRWRHERELRMSRREIKEELRRQEGSAALRRLRRMTARVSRGAKAGGKAGTDAIYFPEDVIEGRGA